MIRRVLSVVAATGIASVATQLSAIREFLTRLSGNEFVISLILFFWLFWGALGTLAARRSSKKASPKGLYGISLLLTLLAPALILSVRKLPEFFFVSGATPGFYATLFYVLVLSAPYGFVLGFALPYGLMTISARHPEFSGTRIYITDNVGDISGAVLFSFVLVYFLSPLQAILAAHLPLILCLFPLARIAGRRIFFSLFGSLLPVAVLAAAALMEPATLDPPSGTLVHYQETPYGRIQMSVDRDQLTLFQNGRPAAFSEDVIAAEETVHYPLSQTQNPRHVLLAPVQGMMVAEIRKYHPEIIDCVEIDPAVTKVQLRFGLLETHPEMRLIHADARRYLSRVKNKYDAIILNLPEPDTFQTNRFFTREFFALARNRLHPGGVLSFSVKGVDAYPSPEEVRKISCIHVTARNIFDHVLMIPGSRIFFVCADHPLSPDIPGKLSEKGISTDYISGFFEGDVPLEKIAKLAAWVADAPVNTDAFPRLVRILQDEWFAVFAASPVLFGMVLAFIILVYACRISRAEFVLFGTGGFVMGSEILVIFAFQVLFGYVYLQIGWIVTAFLAGLLPGALWGHRLKEGGGRLLVRTDAALICLMGVFCGALAVFPDQISPGMFLIFGFAVSLVCGFQFPVALHLQGGDDSAAVRVFSADLMGAAAGTLVTSILLVPVAGIFGAAAALIALKCMGMARMRIA